MDAPFHMQWDADARLPLPDPGAGPDNCGPASVANVAHFYRDSHVGIHLTRRLAVAHDRATTVNEQRVMLEKRGVPCFVAQPSLATVKVIVRSGRRPMILGLFMKEVPRGVAGHPFDGWHAVELLQNAIQGSTTGVLVRDPNFSVRTGRTDPTGGRRFYPDEVIQRAAVGLRSWALIPEKAKLTPDAVREMPMLKYKAEGWTTVATGARLHDGIGGPAGTRLPGGVAVTTIGQSKDNNWRHVLVTIGGENRWYAVKRADLIPMVPGGDPAFDRAIFDHLVSREA